MKDYVFSNLGALHFGMALLSSGSQCASFGTVSISDANQWTETNEKSKNTYDFSIGAESAGKVAW